MNRNAATTRQTTTHPLLWALLFTAVFSLAIYSIAFAQGSTPTDDEVNQIAKKLYCPVCENIPLDACPTEACRQWRDQIREMLSQGKTEAEIIDYFAATYGERAASDPRDKVKAYLVPIVAILLGATGLVSALRKWRKPQAAHPAAPANEAQPPAQMDDYVARIEEELRNRD